MAKCSECGFLSLRNTITGQLDEVDSLYRANAESPKRGRQSRQGTATGSGDSVDVQPYAGMPFCFVQRHELWRDFKGLGPAWKTVSHELLPESLILEVINKTRECSPNSESIGFAKWQQGFTPKEHREMLDRNALFNAQRDQNRWNLGVAFLAVVVAVGGIGISAYFGMKAAEKEANAIIRATQIQVEATRTATPPLQSTPGTGAPPP